jgi:PTH1 family peptidyl-tRNA hydrolase
MKLVVGLGNPGNPYTHTRHNIGAVMLERFLVWEQLGILKYDAKFVAEVLISTVSCDGGRSQQTIFAFPQTFMNLSGNAVESLARFYKIAPADTLVLHDEIELPLGKIALKV